MNFIQINIQLIKKLEIKKEKLITKFLKMLILDQIKAKVLIWYQIGAENLFQQKRTLRDQIKRKKMLTSEKIVIWKRQWMIISVKGL